MDSFKTATSSAAHATLFEEVDDLKFDVESFESRVARLENDLRKRLRTMRKKVDTSRNAIGRQKVATRAYISELRVTHARESRKLRVLEAELADVMKAYPMKKRMRTREHSARPPPKTFVNIFTMADVACVVIPFLNAAEAFQGLACASREHRLVVRRWFPRLVGMHRTLPPFHWLLADLKGLVSVRAAHVRDVDKLAGRLVDLHSTQFPSGFTMPQLSAMAWPRLESLSLPSVPPHIFWSTFDPTKMPRLRRITLAWKRPGPPTWLGRVRALVESRRLTLEMFPGDLDVYGEALTNYLAIHRCVGTTAFTLDSKTDAGMFCSMVGHLVEELVLVNRRPVGPPPQLGWVLSLPRLHTLVVDGLSQSFGDFDADGVNDTITDLTIRVPDTGSTILSTTLLGKLRAVRTLNLSVWSVRAVVSQWKADVPACLEKIEALKLRSIGRYVYSVPYALLPSLATLTVENLSDTQAYCVLADAGRVGPRLTLRMPWFVSNRVGSILRAYDADARCQATVEIKGYMSEFFVLVGGEALQKVKILAS